MVNIHPTADVQSKSIGNNTSIWQFVIILPGAVIGKNCNINAYCFLENDVIVGNNVTIKCGVYLWDGIALEDDVQIGPNVTFTNDLYPRAKHAFNISNTIIKRGASIGANVTIIGGISIGEYALIGAGSVVTKNVPNNILCYGNPARHIAFVCNCGHKLADSLICKECSLQYKIENKQLIMI